MKTKFTSPMLIVLTVILLQACSGPNILKLQPENTTGEKWLYGQRFIADSINGIVYDVGFERCMNEQYWFDFTISNCSNLPILIDPIEFELQAFDQSRAPVNDTKIHALNPEDQIVGLEKSLAKANAREANHFALSLLAVGVDVATGIITATDENPHNDWFRTHLYDDVQIGREVNAFMTEDLKSKKDAWENSTIRKTTLEPNYNIQGKVFFPAVRNASYIKLLLPVDSNYVEINFKQLQIPAN